ncbi:sensor histidine kinase [Palleronia sp. KMU-117]|uniref:sensor histidine kinase n=1 Tax=Palleronia sp. KMU-117 TaxID=3434108 RepID=UPI003D761E12
MSLEFPNPDLTAQAFSEEAWAEVLSAVDRAYADLVSYQEQLERQNEDLHEFRRFLASILTSVSDVMAVVRRDCTIEQASRSLGEALGCGAEALQGRDVTTLFAPDEAAKLAEALDAVRQTRAPVRFETLLQGSDGPAPFDVSVTARVSDRGRMIGAVILGRPLGELRRAYAELEASHRSLKEAQTQLVRNEKLASLGRLLAGVAHELNNPISFVYANAHALERYIGRFETYFERVEAGAPREELVELRQTLKLDRELKNLRTAIDGAREGSERVRDIVADLRRLSVAGGATRERFDLVEAARVATRWVLRGSKSGIEARFEGCDSLQILGNVGHVQQIVMNLVQNALDAMAGVEAPELTLEIGQGDGIAWLTVADTGPGVPEALAASVFDPFFTTKPVGQGTGLGLSISHKIAEEHGGRLVLLPRDRGAAFRLELPQEGGA